MEENEGTKMCQNGRVLFFSSINADVTRIIITEKLDFSSFNLSNQVAIHQDNQGLFSTYCVLLVYENLCHQIPQLE